MSKIKTRFHFCARRLIRVNRRRFYLGGPDNFFFRFFRGVNTGRRRSVARPVHATTPRCTRRRRTARRQTFSRRRSGRTADRARTSTRPATSGKLIRFTSVQEYKRAAKNDRGGGGRRAWKFRRPVSSAANTIVITIETNNDDNKSNNKSDNKLLFVLSLLLLLLSLLVLFYYYCDDNRGNDDPGAAGIKLLLASCVSRLLGFCSRGPEFITAFLSPAVGARSVFRAEMKERPARHVFSGDSAPNVFAATRRATVTRGTAAAAASGQNERSKTLVFSIFEFRKKKKYPFESKSVGWFCKNSLLNDLLGFNDIASWETNSKSEKRWLHKKCFLKKKKL